MTSYKLKIKQNEQLKEYEFNSVELGSLGDIQDELNIDNGKITILKRIGMTNEFLSYVLDTPIIIPIETDYIEFFDGENEIEIETISGNYRVLYVTNDPFNYSTMAKDRVKLTLAVLDNQINMKVQKGSIISEINQSSEEIKVSSNKVKLEGITTINDGFEIDLQGNMQCRNANINNLVNQSGIYTNITFYNRTEEAFVSPRSWGGLSYIGYIYLYGQTPNQKRIPVFINYSIPEEFTVVKAYLIVKHQSITWQTSANPNSRVADIEIYHKQLTFTGSINNKLDYSANYNINLEDFIGTKIDNIWGNGIHSYTFPIGYRTKKTTDIANLINTNKQGVIAFAPKATSVVFDPNNQLSPERDYSSFLGATLYVYGYLNKE